MLGCGRRDAFGRPVSALRRHRCRRRSRSAQRGDHLVLDGADVQAADAGLGAAELRAVQQRCTSAYQPRRGDADLGPRTQISDFGRESWSASQCQCSQERRQCLRVHAIGCRLSHQFGNDCLRVQGEQVKQKLIWFHYLYRKLLGALGRKVRCVERHEWMRALPSVRTCRPLAQSRPCGLGQLETPRIDARNMPRGHPVEHDDVAGADRRESRLHQAV